MSARQLVLDLPHRAARGREDFLVAPANAHAVEMLAAWPRWAEGRCVLVGPAGSGKSHLLAVWAEETGARMISGAALEGLDAQAAAAAPLAVDDAQAAADNPAAEEALFHALNAARAARQPVLMAAPAPVRAWGLGLADLASRLAASQLAAIHPPDEALLAAVMAKAFTDRQLAVDPAVIGYAVRRIERSFAALHAFVAALDARAVRDRRRPTRRLAGEVLAELGYAGTAGGDGNEGEGA